MNNAALNLSQCVITDLTLTRVVFELNTTHGGSPASPDLTLTRVVFECGFRYVPKFCGDNLTLTRVVFEYSHYVI